MQIQAGLVILESQIAKADVSDWKKMSKKFEDQVPNWPPGTASGYHGITFGWLIDQLLRRVDPQQRSMGRFIEEEITKPNSKNHYCYTSLYSLYPSYIAPHIGSK